MLEGITVLSQNTYNYEFFSLLLKIIGIAVVLVGLFLIYCSIICKEYMAIAGCLILIVIGFIPILESDNITKSETLYKVIINDNVSLIEFENKYEVVEVDGLIYTIKEKVDE